MRELASDATRAQAIGALLSEYEDAARNGSQTPEARDFVDRYAEPLAEAYVSGHATLDPKLRLKLITRLVSFHDARTVPAHLQALKAYADTQQFADEAIWACQAAQRLRDDRLSAGLFAVFEAIDMAADDGRRLSRHLREAMLRNPQPSWSARLVEYLKRPLERPAAFNDAEAVRRFQNQLFWLTSSARLLGAVGGAGSERALAEVLLDPSRVDAHPNAELSFVQLGKPSATLAHALLTGSDSDLVARAREARPDLAQAHVFFATEWLIRLRQPSSRAELEAAWDRANDAQAKVLIVRALTYFPKSARSIALFQQTYASARLALTLPAGESALESLVEHSPYFFEPELTGWLMQQPGKIKGTGPRKGDLQWATVVAIGLSMRETDIEAGNAVSQRYGGRSGTPAFEEAAALLRKCKDDLNCYTAEFNGVTGNSDLEVARGRKALVMLGMGGGAEHRDALIAKLSKLRDPRLLHATIRVIDHLSPTSSPALVESVEAAMRARGEAADAAEVAAATELQLLAYRLRAR